MKNLLFTLVFIFVVNINFAQTTISVWPTVVEKHINVVVFSSSLDEYIYYLNHFYDDFNLDSIVGITDNEVFVLDTPDNTYERKEAKISIYEINGRLINSYNIEERLSESLISVEQLKSGIHIMIIEFDKYIYKTKFVKV